ncbi:MAG: GMC family oxidoreductase [Gemmatimonadales bacterium]|nr:GMC family oxidoreductase [Gemmatimonadales bacterium]
MADRPPPHAHAHGARPSTLPAMPAYRDDDAVDFVVVGVGAAGGIVVKQLAEAGYRVVGLEGGPWRKTEEFRHDELSVQFGDALTINATRSPGRFRQRETEPGRPQPVAKYVEGPGGGSIHYAANLWRFREVDFEERSRKGAIAGSTIADWPIRYADLEPYYTQAEYELGVSGAPGPQDAFRSRPFPVPPLEPMSIGALMERATTKLGWTSQAAPMGVLSQQYDGRAGCLRCGWCWGFGCEVGAKASTAVTTIPKALATGRCEIRTECRAQRIAHDARGRATGVLYRDKDGTERFQRAKAVVLCANGAETPRLLLLSASGRFPDGLANSSGLVGRNVMFNGGPWSFAHMPEDVNAFKGPVATRITLHPYELDGEGLQGGGGFDFRMNFPPTLSVLGFAPPGRGWGRDFARSLVDHQRRLVIAAGHTTQLPQASNRYDLDPEIRDPWGLPALRLTFQEHPEDVKMYRWMQARGKQLLEAAGAARIWGDPPSESDEPFLPALHLLGTCRMGVDPATSVVDASHRAHDVPNLFMVDGSSFVTSGRGQPTLTIMALAFRAGAEMVRLARAGALG